MNKYVKSIKQHALSLGACKQVRDVQNMDDLAALLRTPQGIEFCVANAFPSLPVWRQLRAHKYGIHVEKEVNVTNEDAILVHSTGILRFSEPKLHTVVLLHGSKVEVHASNYAVVSIEGEGAEIHKDETSVVMG